jgi:hypothetical protein
LSTAAWLDRARGAANWVWLSFFSLFWLVPVACWGLLGRGSPISIPGTARMTDAFSLFVVSQDYVPLQYVQVLLPGASAWTTEPDHHYLRMTPFGARTRFDEMLRKGLDNEEALVELAAFVRRRHARRTAVDPVAVRFVTGVVVPRREPLGRFRKPALAEIDHIRRQVWFVRTYREVPAELLAQRP